MKKYELVYADPPWKFSSSQRKRDAPWNTAVRYYDCMSVKEIMSIPVKTITTENAVLGIWAPWTFTHEVLQVIDAWGFQFKTAIFVWVKLNKDGSIFKGLGLYTRGGAEVCWLGVKGKGLARIDKGVGQVECVQRGKHSEKPDEIRGRFVQLYGDVERVELFARKEVAGWDCWGNEIKGVDLFLGEELKSEVKKKYSATLCDPKDIPEDALWSTRCSRRKSELMRGVPKEIYTSPQNQEFYLWAEKKSIFYGTISDAYGLVMNYQAIKTYDLSPDSLPDLIKRALGQAVGVQFRDLVYNSLAFYCKNYEEAKPYLEILSHSGLKVYWVRRLSE